MTDKLKGQIVVRIQPGRQLDHGIQPVVFNQFCPQFTLVLSDQCAFGDDKKSAVAGPHPVQEGADHEPVGVDPGVGLVL